MSKLDGYIRVSDVHGRSGESFISPQQQRDKIEAWAKVNDHKIVDWGEDMDVSGGKLSRPGLDRIMERIRSGETQGIAIAKLDRFSRAGVGDALALIEEIKQLDAVFGCIEPAIDTSDPIMGEFVLTIFLALAKMERDRIAASWADAQSRAHARGAHMGRVAPFGYRKRREDGRLEPDPLTAPYLTEIFERRVAGQGWHRIAIWLNSQPALKPLDHRFNPTMLKYILANEVYLGHLIRGDLRLENAHPPLVDFLTWQSVQGPARTPRSGRNPPKHLLSGFCRCSSCRYSMSYSQASKGSYHCRRAPMGLCVSQNAIRAGERLENHVVEEMWKHLAEIEARGYEPGTGLDELESDWKRAKLRHREKSMDLDMLEKMGDDGFSAMIEALKDDAEAKEKAYNEKVRRTGGGKDARRLRRDWESGKMSFEEKRGLLARLIQAVFIKKAPAKGNNGGDLKDRVWIVWASDDVVDVPRTGTRTDLGKPTFVPRPFVFPNGDDPDEARKLRSKPAAVPGGGAVV